MHKTVEFFFCYPPLWSFYLTFKSPTVRISLKSEVKNHNDLFSSHLHLRKLTYSI